MKNKKSADGLLTPSLIPQTQAGVRIKGNFSDADRGGYPPGKKQRTRNILELFLSNTLKKVAKEDLKSYILIKNRSKWRGNSTIPPNSYLSKITAVFKAETDIPLEMPLSAGFNFLAAHLLHLGAHIEFDNQIIKPDLWTILLADSGSAKTFSNTVFEKGIDIKNFFDSGIKSSAKFIEELAKNNNSFWVCDEFAQFLKSIKSQPYLEEMKDYLLKTYDNKTIRRKTKEKEITVETPALVIFGLNVFDTYVDNVSAEDVLDGFAQRFNYIIAKPDPERPPLSVPLYSFSTLQTAVKKAWKGLKFPKQGKKYVLSNEAKATYEDFFLDISSGKDIPGSFLRRTLFKALKYALIYHIILGKSAKKEIDGEDIYWAMQIVILHIDDTIELLETYGFSSLEKTFQQVEALKAKCEASGEPLTLRKIISSVRSIRNANEARQIAEIVKQGR